MNLSFLQHESIHVESLLLFHLSIDILKVESETHFLLIDIHDPVFAINYKLMIWSLQTSDFEQYLTAML